MKIVNTWPGWECVRQIGAGAFGKVYEIQKEENGKIYKAALKVISIPQEQSDIDSALSEGMTKEEVTSYFKSFVNNITNEFALMSDLKGYTNIVSYEDHMVLEREESIGWDILIRMELLIPLHKWIADHTMDEKNIVKLGSDVCRALELCHGNKIIHRDIKPENIFVNKNGDFKLGDFGIARVVEKTSNVMSQQRGTYTYMAPEVFKGQYYNHTADIYSLGVVLYRFLNNNRTPFLPQGTLVPTDREKAQDRRMSGEQIPEPLNGSEKLKQAVLMAIEYDPNKRMQSAQAFRTILDHCGKKATGESHPLPPEQEQIPESDDQTRRTPVKIPTETPKKKKWILPVGIAVVVVLVIFIINSMGGNHKVPSEISPSQSVVGEMEQIFDENNETNTNIVTTSNITLDDSSIILNEEGKEPVVWHLPVMLDEFKENGWSLDISFDSYVNPGTATAMLTKNDSSCMVFIQNDGVKAKRAGECDVTGVVVYNEMNTYIQLKGGINLNSTVEEIESIYGEPDVLYRENGYVYTTYAGKRIHSMTGYEQALLYLVPGYSYDENFFYQIDRTSNEEENDVAMYMSVVLRKQYDDPSYNGCWEEFYEICSERGIYCEIYWPDSEDNIEQQVEQTSAIVETHNCDILFVEAPDGYSMKDVINAASQKGISVIGLNDYMNNTDTNINEWINWKVDEWNKIFDVVQEAKEYNMTEGGIHSYEIVMDDCSWDEAYQKALDMGGYLVRINSEEEYKYIISMLEETNYQDVLYRIGARRDSNSKDYYWVNVNNKCYGERLNDASSWMYTHWKEGEPNFQYGGNEEDCVEIHCKSGATRWTWNDIPNKIVELAPSNSGKVAFIVEFE